MALLRIGSAEPGGAPDREPVLPDGGSPASAPSATDERDDPPEPATPDPEPAAAEPAEADRFRTVVRPRGRGDAQRNIDRRTPGFATAIDLEAEPGARPADGVAEVIARTPGATVRSIGGLGQFSAVSLRGSAPQQVAVFLDGVPLGGAMAGLVDLSDLSLDGMDRIEVYRGHIPVAFGGATIGGAINLVPRRDLDVSRVRVTGGYGSMGARESRVEVSAPARPGLQLTARVAYTGAKGNFRYYDNAGTPTWTGDDRTRRRANNDYDRVLGQLRVDGRHGSTRFGVAQFVAYKHQGIAGPVGVDARAAALSTVAARTIAHVRRDGVFGPGGRLQWVMGLGLQQQVFSDPLDEIGIDIDNQRVRTLDLYVSPRVRIPLWPGAFLGIVADARPEAARVDERAPTSGPSQDSTRRRLSTGAGVELEQFLFDRRWLLVPVMRVDAIQSWFKVPAGGGQQNDLGRNDVAMGYAPRLGTRIRAIPGLELRASGGRYFRPPTLSELFGDRGYFVGNEGLRPERGTAIDGGAVVDVSRPHLSVYAQVAGFATWSRDLIQWVAAGSVARPENVSAARTRGLETSLDVAPPGRELTLTANYTLLDTRNLGQDPTRHGKQLPGRPRHELFARATTGHEWLARGVPLEPRLLYTVEFIAGTYLDPSGRLRLPRRVLQGLGVELHVARRVHVAVEVRNLLDVRTTQVVFPVAGRPRVPMAIADFIGYPLPGRSVWANLRIDMPPPHRAGRRRSRKRRRR